MSAPGTIRLRVQLSGAAAGAEITVARSGPGSFDAFKQAAIAALAPGRSVDDIVGVTDAEGDVINRRSMNSLEADEQLTVLLRPAAEAPVPHDTGAAVAFPGTPRELPYKLYEATLDYVADKAGKESKLYRALDVARGFQFLGSYDPTTMYWGSVENFAGMERAFIVVAGFMHPLYLDKRFPAPVNYQKNPFGFGRASLSSKSDAETQINPRVYLGMTRCTFQLVVVEHNAKQFAAHFQVGKVRDGAVPYSDDSKGVLHAYVENSSTLRCPVTMDLLPPGSSYDGEQDLATVCALTLRWPPEDNKIRCSWGSAATSFPWEACKSLREVRFHLHERQRGKKEQKREDAEGDWSAFTQCCPSLQRLQVNGAAGDLQGLLAVLPAFVDLRAVVLANNPLKSIPPEIGQLTALQTLHLDNIQLGSRRQPPAGHTMFSWSAGGELGGPVVEIVGHTTFS